MTQQFPPSGQYGAQPQWAPPTAQIPPKKQRKWPWIVGIVVAFLFGIAVSGGSKTSTTSAAGGVSTTQTVTVAAPAPQQAAEPAVAEAPAAQSGPKTSFGDGTWVVGEDIVPGTYKSAGAQAGIMELCSVTTHSDENADSNTTLDWKTANANEPIRLKADGKVKAVKASGCEDFVKVG